MMPTVAVVMSSYNGEGYIEEQIESVLSQRGVNVSLTIRDDGSKDSTYEIAASMAKRDSRIIVEKGVNLGFANGFLEALRLAPDADYYAFCDQDDVWLPDKLAISVALCKSAGTRALSFCNAVETDARLNPFRRLYTEDKSTISLSMVFTDCIAHGFLILFDKQLRDDAIKVERIAVSHDTWVNALAALTGSVQYKDEVVAMHRRLDNSVSRIYPFKMILYRINTLLSGGQRSADNAALFLRYYSDKLSDDNRDLLRDMSEYKDSWKSKKRLIRRKDLRRKGFFGRAVMVAKVLLNRY